jgi:phosphoribosylanthranilate isomerase
VTSKTRIKVCGITRLEDALAASDLGADALGFILWEKSPRYILPEEAGKIIRALPPFVLPVGVFVNNTPDEIAQMATRSGIRVAQLHGDETPQTCERLSIPGYKVFHVRTSFDCSALARYPSSTLMLDTYRNGERGGTGHTFDWGIAVEAKRYGRVILSGGISPDNIREAIRVVEPYAVDVNSSIESTPGRKDHKRMRELFTALHSV